MKFSILFAILSSAIVFTVCETEEEAMAWLQQVVSDCAIKENAAGTDIDEILAYKSASTYQGKCFRACIGEATGIVKNNKIDLEFALSKIDEAFEAEKAAEAQAAREIFTACAEVTDPDRCEAATKIFDCGRDTAVAKGYNPVTK